MTSPVMLPRQQQEGSTAKFVLCISRKTDPRGIALRFAIARLGGSAIGGEQAKGGAPREEERAARPEAEDKVACLSDQVLNKRWGLVGNVEKGPQRTTRK